MFDKKKYYKEYYEKNKEKCKGYIKKYQTSEKGKKKITEYRKEYWQRPKVKEQRSIRDKERYYRDDQNKTYRQINKQINRCIRYYLKNGELVIRDIYVLKYQVLYGIDLHKIIEHLKPFPKNIDDYELDHIIPISSFDLNKKEDIEKAYKPTNLQLLTPHENRKKSNN